MLLFDDCSFYYNEDTESDRPFVIGVKDREHSDDNMERWDMVSLSRDDAKKIYELLKNHFEDWVLTRALSFYPRLENRTEVTVKQFERK